MLKSTAGGGGIGMRLIWSEDELADAFASVERLARANFKDAGIYLEKYVEQARHIEVQIFGDGHGNVVALGERDCSVQRRNQKVIEETPRPACRRRTRARLLDTAVRLGQAVGYQIAGTVEFVLDAAHRRVLFPRGEHAAAGRARRHRGGDRRRSGGVDGAAGGRRAATSRGIRAEPRGASIQVRLYAEDPAQEFPARAAAC